MVAPGKEKDGKEKDRQDGGSKEKDGKDAATKALTGDGGPGGVEGHLLRPAVADERRVHVLGPSCD